MIKKIRTT